MNSVFNINKLLDKSLPLKLIQRFLYLFVTYIIELFLLIFHINQIDRKFFNTCKYFFLGTFVKHHSMLLILNNIPSGTSLMFVHVGKGLPTYCVTRAVGRQPLAANDKQDIENAVTPLIRPKVYDQ